MNSRARVALIRPSGTFLYLDCAALPLLKWCVRGWMAIHPRTAILAPVPSPIKQSPGAWDQNRLSRDDRIVG